MLLGLYIVLAIVTVVYMVLSARMDLRERQIYTTPCFFLTLSWWLYLFNMGIFDWKILVIWFVVHYVLYRLFNHFRIWGAGDSDVFLLLSNILLVVIGERGYWTVLFTECVCIVMALAIAILVAIFEFRGKEEQVNLHSKVAVVPGFAVVVIILLGFGLLGRLV